MPTVAVYVVLNTLASCSETRALTTTGYVVITECEMFFVSKERFLKKYKDNIFIMPGVMDRLPTFEEASSIRDTVLRLDACRTVKAKEKNCSVVYEGDSKTYSLFHQTSDVRIRGRYLRVELSGAGSNVDIRTEDSFLNLSASSTTYRILADRTTVTMYASKCFIDLSGEELDVLIIGNGNTISGITSSVRVFTRGKQNEFIINEEASEEDKEKA